MKLYGFPASPNTWKVRAVAAYLKMPLELEFVDLAKGAQRTPDYLALNPTGRTPTLVDGDSTLWESNAIMQYIAGKTTNALCQMTIVSVPRSPAGSAGSSRIGVPKPVSR